MKIAAIQMCSSHIIEDNLATAAMHIQEAAEHGAKLVILPEMFAIMGTDQQDKVVAKESYGDGNIQHFLADTAKKHSIWLVAGTIPLASDEPSKIRAACLVINSDGIVVARYDKIHLFDVTASETEVYQESTTTEQGNDSVVIDTPVGKLGLAVCYDIRFPELFRALMQDGAEIIAIPSAFTVPTGEAHWELLARARAVDNLAYIVGACQGGTHTSGRKTFGHSLIVDPWGSIIAKKDTLEPGVIYATIDPARLKKVRAAIPLLKHAAINKK